MARVIDIDLPYQAVSTARRLGELLSTARRARGWTQADLAAKADVGLSTVYAAERGDPRIGLQFWLKLLWAADQLRRFDAALDPTQDAESAELALRSLPKRIRNSRA